MRFVNSKHEMAEESTANLNRR